MCIYQMDLWYIMADTDRTTGTKFGSSQTETSIRISVTLRFHSRILSIFNLYVRAVSEPRQTYNENHAGHYSIAILPAEGVNHSL